MISKTVSHYRITDQIGSGGMGVVYKAEDLKLKRTVALKFLPPELTRDPEAKARFIHEAQAASALEHPNICNIHEIDETDDGQIFIVMACYEGETLRNKIKETRIKTEDAIEYAIQIAKGLARAHEAKEIHRDIKPGNIIITNHNEVKIIDFGLARLTGQTKLTNDSLTMGTIDYMSPEQAQGNEIDYRSDIWSFGVVLYEMLSGERPFKGEYDQAVVYSIINKQLVPLEEINEDIPKDLINIVNRCLMKNPEERFSSMNEIVHLLKPYQIEKTTSYSDYKIFHPDKKIIGRKRYLLTGIIFIVILLGWFVWKWFFALPGEKHLAVLPFTNIGSDEKNSIYCDGLLEIITSRLTQIQQYQNAMFVVPSSEIRRYKIKSAKDAHTQFNVNLAITGSIERRTDYFQLILNLVDALTYRQIKSEDLRINEKEISSILEEEVMDKIIDMLELHLQSTIRADFFAGGTKMSDAYDYYVQGKGYLQRYEDQDNIDTAIRLFQQALNLDSAFTVAWAGLGEAYWRKYEATKDISYVEPAMTTCRRAIKQNDHYAEVYVTCGMINIGIGEYELAVEELKKALKIDSLNGIAYRKLGLAYQSLGDSAAALKTYLKAIEKRPGSWQGYSYLGYFYLVNGDYHKAIEPYEKIVELLPHSDRGYNKLSATYFYLDRFSDAAKYGRKAVEINPSYIAMNNLASYYYYSGDYAESAKMYREVYKINQNSYIIPGNLASAFFYSDQNDSARLYYQKAIQLAERTRKINPHEQLALTAIAGYYAKLQEKEKSYKILEEIEGMNPNQPDILFNIGDTYEQLGERDLALIWMKKAIQKGYTMAKFKYNPGLKNLIADERFQRIWQNKNEGGDSK